MISFQQLRKLSFIALVQEEPEEEPTISPPELSEMEDISPVLFYSSLYVDSWKARK